MIHRFSEIKEKSKLEDKCIINSEPDSKANIIDEGQIHISKVDDIQNLNVFSKDKLKDVDEEKLKDASVLKEECRKEDVKLLIQSDNNIKANIDKPAIKSKINKNNKCCLCNEELDDLSYVLMCGDTAHCLCICFKEKFYSKYNACKICNWLITENEYYDAYNELTPC